MVRPFQGKSSRIHETAFVAETADVIGDGEVGEHSSIWFRSGPLHGGAGL